MTILLIEDDENKRNHLRQYLATEFPGVKVEIARSYRSGLEKLTLLPDLLLLDMTLPNFDPGPDETGGQTHRFGGRDILRQIDRKRLRIPVVVVTQFERFEGREGLIELKDLDKQLKRDHKSNYRGVVYYHPSSAGWRERLSALIDTAIREAERA